MTEKKLQITDDKVLKLIDYIKTAINGTYYDGHVYIVGGAVRDWLMGKECKDIDLVVDLPNGGEGIAKFLTFSNNCNISEKNPVIFPTYGTAKFQLLNSVDFGDISLEAVQTRKEQYHKDSRKPETAFGTIEEDATRRDLTINALYYNISTGVIHDYTGKGFNDLEKHIIRTPSEPDVVFSDDPLRILRVIRFATRLQWGIEKNTWLGMIKNDKRILYVSQERITDELNKILLTEKPSLGFKRMAACNHLLEHVFPGLMYEKHLYQDFSKDETVFDHTLKVVDKVPSKLEVRLGALLHDIGKLSTYKENYVFHETEGAKLTEKLLKAMKYSNDIINKVVCIVKTHEVFSFYTAKETPSAKYLKNFKLRTGELIEDVLEVIDANNNVQKHPFKAKQVENIRAKIAEIEKKEKKPINVIKLPISGYDIIDKFSITSGPMIGRILSKVKKAYIENPSITKEECFDLVSDAIKELAV